MLWLIYGWKGWIGGQIVDILRQLGEQIAQGNARLDNYQQTLEEIQNIKPNRIICAIGRTAGPGHPNIDYLELPGKLPENLRDNLHGPLNLAMISQDEKIHMTYIGTGCIYEFDEKHLINWQESQGYTENEAPNFNKSQYSAVKGVTDQLIINFKNVLNARIRMPITYQNHPHNFITKIAKYMKVISIPNSMTILPQLLPLLIDLAKKETTGPINLTNPGAISHKEVLDLYTEIVDPNFKYEIMDLAEFQSYIIGQRSNNYLDTSLLEQHYPHIMPIKEAIREALRRMKLTN